MNGLLAELGEETFLLLVDFGFGTCIHIMLLIRLSAFVSFYFIQGSTLFKGCADINRSILGGLPVRSRVFEKVLFTILSSSNGVWRDGISFSISMPI